MELESQVVSLELAKQLKELGVSQDSLFYWCLGRFDQPDKTLWELNDCIDTHASENVSAFTVAELGELVFKADMGFQTGVVQREHKKYYIAEYERENGLPEVYEKTEADARASMCIWLIKNGYLNAEDIK